MANSNWNKDHFKNTMEQSAFNQSFGGLKIVFEKKQNTLSYSQSLASDPVHLQLFSEATQLFPGNR